MIQLLAQTAALPEASSSAAMGWVLAVLFAIASGALIIKQLIQRTPSLHEEFVTRKEFDAHVDDVKEQLKDIAEKGEARVVRIYDKIDESADRTVERIVEIIHAGNAKK